MKETELAKILVDKLDMIGFETYKEVYLGSAIDVVAKMGDIYIAFETKTTLNDTVLSQARYNTSFCNYSFAVIPASKRRNYHISEVKRFFCSHYGIGVLTIFDTKDFGAYGSGFNLVEDIKLPYGFNLKMRPKKFDTAPIKNFLYEDQKGCIAGSQSGKVITGFKRSMNLITKYAENNKIESKRQIWNDLKEDFHWRSYNSMTSALSSLNHVECVRLANEAIDKSMNN